MKFYPATPEEIQEQAYTVALNFAGYMMAGEIFDECYTVGRYASPESGEWDLRRALSSLNAAQRLWETESEVLMEMFPSIGREFPAIRRQTLAVIGRANRVDGAAT